MLQDEACMNVASARQVTRIQKPTVTWGWWQAQLSCQQGASGLSFVTRLEVTGHDRFAFAAMLSL
jgi:hypothetical protein